MLIQFIFSIITSLGFMWIWTMVSGGYVQNYSYFLYLFMLGCCIPFIFMKSNFKSLKLLFSKKKNFDLISIEQCKKFEYFISFIIKIQFLFALMFMGIASINFFSNLDNLQYLGPNLATIIEAPLFACVITIILLPLKTRSKNYTISLMQEKNNELKSSNKIIIPIIKIIMIIIWVIFCLFLIYNIFTKGHISLLSLFDLPAFLLVFLFFSSYLLISGSTKIFINAIVSTLTNDKISVSEKAKYQNTIQGLIKSQLCVGGMSFLSACLCMLFNLEVKECLGPNYNVAILGFLYSIFVSIILLVINAVIYTKE